MSNIRLDSLLFQRGLTESRERAKAIIMSGSVFIGGIRADKPGMQVDSEASVEVRSAPDFVSRGGHKLEKALKQFKISPADKACIDCGASTGGFTDCLLKYGAKLVYAVDVGYGQLAWSLRNDERVVLMERTNIRHVTADMFNTKPELAAVDVSFISLALVLPVVKSILTDDSEAICLIKPQFEAGREKVGKNGVVRDKATHVSVLRKSIQNAEESGFYVNGITFSPIRGPKGNIEYLSWLKSKGESRRFDLEGIVGTAHEEFEVQRNVQ